VASALALLSVPGSSGGLAADPTAVVADTAAVAKDREAVRGNWRVVELHVDGQRAADEDARRFSVSNAGDGTWALLHDGGEMVRGGSTIEPEAVPKRIDFTATDAGGEVQHYLGVYELGDPVRKLCFARPGRPRPVDFTSTVDNEQLLIVFQRE
jgi:uncharacterized protein (TIGR03067 family)